MKLWHIRSAKSRKMFSFKHEILFAKKIIMIMIMDNGSNRLLRSNLFCLKSPKMLFLPNFTLKLIHLFLLSVCPCTKMIPLKSFHCIRFSSNLLHLKANLPIIFMQYLVEIPNLGCCLGRGKMVSIG
jgi:hypothetical protein